MDSVLIGKGTFFGQPVESLETTLLSTWSVHVSLRLSRGSLLRQRHAAAKHAKYVSDAIEEQDKVDVHGVPEPMRRKDSGGSNQNVDPYPLMHMGRL